MSALAEAGIRLKSQQPGTHRLPCPGCGKGSRDDALQLTVTSYRWAFWRCWRCGWEGGAPLDAAARPMAGRRRQERPSAPKPTGGLSPWAMARWRECRPIAPGTPAALYLRRRGCALPASDQLRWHPALKHKSGHVGPALVALVTEVLTGEAISLHRTWIKPDGGGKADLPKPRLLLKGHRARGGVVRLVDDAAVTTGLCLAEGLETALAAALGFAPVWATLDAGNLAAFPVLPGIESLTILADHDRPNPKTGRRAGLDAAQECAERWARAGREVRIWKAPAEGRDFNDFVAEAA